MHSPHSSTYYCIGLAISVRISSAILRQCTLCNADSYSTTTACDKIREDN